MLSRRLRPVPWIALATLTFSAPLPASAARIQRATFADVRLAVEPGGGMLVTETTTVVFEGETSTSVSRALPARRIDSLQIVSVSMDGRELSRGRGPGHFDVVKKDEGQRRLVWRFEPAARATHTFTFVYRVTGVVRHEPAADLLVWRAVPAKADYDVGCARIALTSPAGTPVRDGSTDPPAARAAAGPSGARFERCGFTRDDGWLVTARFAPRSIAASPPDWQRRSVQASRALPLFLGLAGLVLIAGLMVYPVFALNQRHHVLRDRHARRSAPPDALPVVLAGALAHDGRVSWNLAQATLLDLARRRGIRVDEIDGGRFRTRDFAITADAGSGSLLPAEYTLVTLLFEHKAGIRSTVKASELAKVFGSPSRWGRFSRAVKADLRTHGLLDAERVRTRGRATLVAVGIVAAGVVGMVAAVPFVGEYGGAALTVGAALIVVGLAGIAVAQSMTPLTEDASRRAHAWRAYGRHLEDLAKGGRQPLTTPAALEQMLPFAAAFGVALPWAKTLRKQGVAAGPSWLRILHREGTTTHPMDVVVALLASGAEAGKAVEHASAVDGASAAASVG